MKPHLEHPQDIRHQIWKELGRACLDRHHEWRTPVLATVDAQGWAQARTVVLRQAYPTPQTLTLYTDRRSGKSQDLQARPQAVLVFWSKRLSWQLRVQVQATLYTDGPEVQTLWQTVRTSPSAGDYLGHEPPGSPVRAGEPQTNTAQAHHFALVKMHVQDMDWLELDRDGHRRARIGADTWSWLTP